MLTIGKSHKVQIYNEQQRYLPFRQDSEVITTSAPNPRQHSAIFSSSVATTAMEKIMKEFVNTSRKEIRLFSSQKIIFCWSYSHHRCNYCLQHFQCQVQSPPPPLHARNEKKQKATNSKQQWASVAQNRQPFGDEHNNKPKL
jgi:hypothetical protein